MIKVSNLNAYYDQFHVLKDVCIEVKAGEVVVILGPNGHGKSTLLKIKQTSCFCFCQKIDFPFFCFLFICSPQSPQNTKNT